MTSRSKIEWTGHTWNPIAGCSVVSPGCTNCYAMKMAGRLEAMGQPLYAGLTKPSKAGTAWTGEVRLADERTLLAPLRRRTPTTWFVNSMSDLFHESVPDEWIDRIFAVMALCPQHTFQVLTKRSARMREYLAAEGCTGGRAAQIVVELMGEIAEGSWEIQQRAEAAHRTPPLCERWPLPNVWLGVSCEDQQRADERIPDLLATPAAVRFVSAEPLLGPIDFTFSVGRDGQTRSDFLAGSYAEVMDPYRDGPLDRTTPRLDWIIVGGESGKNARPMHPDWARSIRDQCEAAGVPFFMKQWGEWGPGAAFAADVSARRVYRGEIQTLEIAGSRPIKLCIPTRDDDELGPALTLERFGKKRAGRLLDGHEHNGMPEARP